MILNFALIVGGQLQLDGVFAIFIEENQTTEKPIDVQSKEISQNLSTKTLDPETIFKFRPEIREDDKEIVSFIFENGGEAKESELRKKFLQPRTTMWRAVKRLERYGIIEIEKKDHAKSC